MLNDVEWIFKFYFDCLLYWVNHSRFVTQTKVIYIYIYTMVPKERSRGQNLILRPRQSPQEQWVNARSLCPATLQSHWAFKIFQISYWYVEEVESIAAVFNSLIHPHFWMQGRRSSRSPASWFQYFRMLQLQTLEFAWSHHGLTFAIQRYKQLERCPMWTLHSWGRSKRRERSVAKARLPAPTKGAARVANEATWRARPARRAARRETGRAAWRACGASTLTRWARLDKSKGSKLKSELDKGQRSTNSNSNRWPKKQRTSKRSRTKGWKEVKRCPK